jgi:hypothetical protein
MNTAIKANMKGLNKAVAKYSKGLSCRHFANVTYVQIVGEMQNLAKKLNFSNCRLSGRLMDIIGTGNIHEQKHSICYPGNRSRHVSGLGPIGPLFGNPAGVR